MVVLGCCMSINGGGGSNVVWLREAIGLNMSKGSVVGLIGLGGRIQAARVLSDGGFELQARAGGVADTQW